jgi:aspartyl-tRNA(Asn)/glutamyl-tRNA(Gln) amidotransferase subunit A
VSNAGIIPNYPSFDCAGPITRTAADAAAVLHAIAGYDPSDFATVRTPVDDYQASLSGGARALRIGVLRKQMYEPAAAEVRSAFDTALGVYRMLAAVVTDIEIEIPEIATLKDAARPELGQRYAEDLRSRPRDIGEEVRAKLQAALSTDLESHIRSRRASERMAESMRRALEEVDVLAMPTVPVVAPTIGTRAIPFGGVDADIEDVLIANARVFNLARLPALTHPCGFSPSGLPVGLQLVGRPFDEALLLRIAHAYATATDWHRYIPGREPVGTDWRRVTH